MRKSILREFGQQKPRAIVLDDSGSARKMTARRLRSRGFEVVECASAEQFRNEWIPGTVDVIISDWDLSHDPDESGEQVLSWVRSRDWDVPFVLISGKLDEATQKAAVLESLLGSGGARFVTRGASGIRQACDLAEDLIERRDLALLKVILAMRPAALEGAVAVTSAGGISARDTLSDIVSRPANSHNAGRPIASVFVRKMTLQ